MQAIEVESLRKVYGDVVAVDGISFSVESGECLALLGPNGAGKTTTTEILEGFRKADSGSAKVLGVDPAHGGMDWKARLGIVLQADRDLGELTVHEAVHHFALYEYLSQFLAGTGARVWPEFPAGNGAVDLLVRCEGRLYPLELKSFTHERDFPPALKQAARYAASLGEDTVHLAVFVEEVPDEYRKKYETPCRDEESGVLVVPVLVETGP